MLDGPRLGPLSGRARQLVVILHGYGADGHDLIPVAEAWRPALPDAAFVAPDGPEPCAHMPDGRQWFPLDLRDPREYWAGCLGVRPAVDAFLDAELERLGLDDGALVLVGFSQGTMTALHVGLRRARPAAALVGYSGRLAGLDRLGEITARPPVTLIHGAEDDVIAATDMAVAATALDRAGLRVETHLVPRLGHEIDRRGLDFGLAAVRRALASA
ncbi:alpha/beta hydrolase [Phreatobacter sp. AB_2022a]|uniref:alpha/beta hydrolase n=1 Tax=Phreatobacter sp. AB_2022a TaxID=3003134 RepID=UPI0022875DE7|nr:phospholipase [Phreatobacter sp. AB_2022a]MCZ0738239.1 phospholipase [Phreatobacter sp. AB_2022a]